MRNSGVWEIASHSSSHRDMTTLLTADGALDVGAVTLELQRSQEVLQDIVGTPVKSFAYPYGNATAEIAAIAAEYYAQAFAIPAAIGKLRGEQQLLAMTRLIISPNVTDFARLVEKYRLHLASLFYDE